MTDAVPDGTLHWSFLLFSRQLFFPVVLAAIGIPLTSESLTMSSIRSGFCFDEHPSLFLA